jgi:HEPN domain-containing protein
MTPAEESLHWATRADHDFTAIDARIKCATLVWDVLCSLSQQAAEKYLRAFLIINSYEPPRTHNLEDLLTLCLQFDSALAALQQQCKLLNPYAVASRYPFSNPTEQAGREAIAAAQRIRDEIRKRLS